MDEDEKGFYVPGTKGHWAVYPKYRDGSTGRVRIEHNYEEAGQMASLILRSDWNIKQVKIDWVIEP